MGTFAGTFAALLTATFWLAGMQGCTNDSAVHEVVPAKDSGTILPPIDGGNGGSDGGDGGGPSDCFMNPKTHEEIINACTTAVRIDKRPNLPLLLSDGGLPPLP